jgi:site-specific recombinase XerD
VSQEQHQTDIRKDALTQWYDELATQSEVTGKLYKKYFKEFCEYINQTPDQILAQRIKDDTNPNRRVKKRYETLFKQFLKHKKTTPKPNGELLRPTTLQTIYAGIRSFFELHDYPLKMRRKDYPKGKALGVKRATKEQVLKVLDANPNKPRLIAIIIAINDSGLGVSDLRKLKCGLFLNKPTTEVIPYHTLRQKTGDTIKTFFAEESITAIQAYIKHRKKGTRKLKPETITPDSPLFVKHQKGKPVKIERTDLSTLVESAFLRVGLKHLSAHSIRKKLQTCLEKGNVPTNWIDQILGHELINSRDAYSLPTDEELQEAYEKAYNQVRLFPKTTTSTTITTTQTNESPFAEAKTLEECKQLLLKGYKFEMNHNGTSLFRKTQTCKT